MKIIASIHPDIAALIPKHPKELVFVKAPAMRGVSFYKDVDFIVPHQKNGEVDPEASKVLNTIKPTGWDWLPESLRWQQRALFVWGLSPYHRTAEVKEVLEKHGFKCEDRSISPELFQEFLDNVQPLKSQKREQETDYATLYPRTRFLWANHHEKFTPWENNFVLNIGKMLKANKPLSKPQLDSLMKVLQKYKVPADATASVQAF